MKRNLLYITAATALSISMLSSCNLYKKFEMPTDESELAREYVQAGTEGADTTSIGTLRWQEVFTDPVLADLINQALANNTNLQNAKLNVDIAHAQLKGAKLAYFPSAALAPNGGTSWFDGNKSPWTYQIPLSVSWEVDIFGKLLNSKRGAQAALYQSEAYQQAVRSQIIAAVANTYYAIATLESQLKLSRNTAELWAQSVEVMKNLKLAGRVNESAVVQSTAQYYSILASITDLELSLVEANNTMSLLLNVLPQSWNIPADASLTAPASMQGSISIAQLSCRPDVRSAEQQLAVAYYATNQARAAFYPGLNITANGGFTNALGTLVTNPGKFFINLAGSLTAPLFSRGANISHLEASKAQQEQAMNNFEYTLLSASAEVSNAMTVYEKSAEKYALLLQQIENLEKSVEYTNELLVYGTSTYLEVLTAQQSLLSAQMSAISCEHSRAQAVINMYQSLGGGRY